MEERFGRCPFYTTQRLIQGKWAILILHYLSGGPVRFNELQRKMPKMTHATLSNQLKQLEAEGLVKRTVYGDIPPKVEYSLTEIGKKFQPVLESIQTFGKEYIAQMNGETEEEGQAAGWPPVSIFTGYAPRQMYSISSAPQTRKPRIPRWRSPVPRYRRRRRFRRLRTEDSRLRPG